MGFSTRTVRHQDSWRSFGAGDCNRPEAIEHPRIRHDGGQNFGFENRLPSVAIRTLESQGLVGIDMGPWARPMGGVNAILRFSNGLLLGGADPRRSSYACAL